MPQTTSSAQQQLKRLGAGGKEDRLRFRLVLGIMMRCLELLESVQWHLIGIVVLTATFGIALVAPLYTIYDTFWTRVLQGKDPTARQAALLKLFGVNADPWTHEARKAALRAVVFGSAGLALVAAVAFMSVLYYRIWILQRINHVLRLRLLDRLQALSLRFHNDSAVGDTMYRMYQDSAVVTQLIDVLILLPLWYGLWITISVGVLALLHLGENPEISFLLVVGWPVAFVLGYRFSRRLRGGFRRAREHNSALTSLIQANMQGIRVIKAFGAEHEVQADFERASKAAFAEAYEARSAYMAYHTYIHWAFSAAIVIAGGWGAYLAMRGAPLSASIALLAGSAWTLGTWNGFKGFAGGGAQSSVGLFSLWGRMQDIAIGLDRVLEVLDIEPEVQDAPDAHALAPFRDAIEFDHVSFAYDPARPTLRDVSIRAKAGTITAIVGPTGSGKSTLMSLLLRLYDPSEGSIRIDGVDLKQLKLQSLRANIAIALQENLLFGTTIRDNIRYAVPDASDAAVRAAARVACADEFIERLPEGYDTLLGERGQKLSTGQRQRLSIARAILKDTPILILDEPTAALDARTELTVLDNLASWGKGRAIFLITHRLSTIRRADQVAFLGDGKLIECDSHAALMARSDSAYRRLVETEEALARVQAKAVIS